MDLISTIIIGLLVAAIPLALFIGLISLALLIWCWGRIGRYFINLGRWVADWRNFLPMTILGTVYLVILVLLWRLILPQASVLWIALLVLHAIVTLVCIFFAAIVWIFWFHQWFWPMYRRWLWGVFAYLFGRGHRRMRVASARPPRASVGGRLATEPMPPTGLAPQRRPPRKRSMLAYFWALMLGKPAGPAKPAAPVEASTAGPRPGAEGAPAKRSWFGTFWALMLGKPQPKRQQARPARVETTEQTVGPSETPAATMATEPRVSERTPAAGVPARRRDKAAKRSWLGSFWGLMVGAPAKPGRPMVRQPKPRVAATPEPTAAATPAADESKGARVAVGGEKPKKRGLFAGIAHTVGAGIEWIRVRLNLD
ncbi:MAG: hypothetical protein QUS33_10145 [Dehalococcoidia bacterium]|nr:hypothetical protein [Dehalococcoidia bacterium]